MPPEGDTTVTIPGETAEKLASLMVTHDFDSVATAITHAADVVQVEDETVSDADLAGLPYQRLSS